MASFSSIADTFSDFRMSAVSSLQRMEPAPTESLGTRLGRRETMSSLDFIVIDVAPFESLITTDSPKFIVFSDCTSVFITVAVI